MELIKSSQDSELENLSELLETFTLLAKWRDEARERAALTVSNESEEELVKKAAGQ